MMTILKPVIRIWMTRQITGMMNGVKPAQAFMLCVRWAEWRRDRGHGTGAHR